MTPRQKTRAWTLGSLILMAGGASWMIAIAFQETLTYFVSPSQALSQLNSLRKDPKKHKVRLGGIVCRGSIRRIPPQTLFFEIEDFPQEPEKKNAPLAKKILVIYKGLVPGLFREGQGVIVEGTLETALETSLENREIFRAQSLLTKHDETYKPPASSFPNTTSSKNDGRLVLSNLST